MGPCQGSGCGWEVHDVDGQDGTWTDWTGRYADGGDAHTNLSKQHPPWVWIAMNAVHFASHEMTPTRSGLRNGCGTPPKAPLAFAQCHFGTSKVHCELLRRIGRQLSKIQLMRIRIGAKQLVVVNMLTCSEVPGGGTFASKLSSNKIILRRFQGGNNFVVIPFERNALPVSLFF